MKRADMHLHAGKLIVPYFWVKALKALDTAVQAIHRRDEAALESLADVRVLESPTLPGSTEGPTSTGEDVIKVLGPRPRVPS